MIVAIDDDRYFYRMTAAATFFESYSKSLTLHEEKAVVKHSFPVSRFRISARGAIRYGNFKRSCFEKNSDTFCTPCIGEITG
jgi:hypothetical protein